MTSLFELAEQLGNLLTTHHIRLTVAESCTGGGLASALTAIPGSSHWFERGFITYSNEAKQEMLGVSETILQTEGAVSEATVCAMAMGAIRESHAQLSVAISGIAGPSGGTTEKPVGTVWIAWSGLRQPTIAHCYTFSGNRDTIRSAAVFTSIQGLIERVRTYQQPVSSKPCYFFALWPDTVTRNKIHDVVKPITQSINCLPTLPEDFHLTLAYLGALNPTECQRIQTLNCPLSSFLLNFTQIDYLSAPNLTYLSPEPSLSLAQLHVFLNHHLLQEGFKPERRPWIPHVTLARHLKKPISLNLPNPIEWFVSDLCFVQSQNQLQTARYEILKRVPLI